MINNLIFKPFENLDSKKSIINEIRENLQIFIIAILNNRDFYSYFAFTGGTCLRLMHDISRYSENLDFDIIDPNKNVSLEPYFLYIKEKFKEFNINCVIEYKNKKKVNSIKKCFLNFDIKELLKVFGLTEFDSYYQEGQKLKIKFEVETDLNKCERFEIIENNYPLYQINCVAKESMFANKLNAVLRRNEQENIKGRDFFDLKYYIDNNIQLNLELFNYCFLRDGITMNGEEKHIDPPSNKDELVGLLKEKIKLINFDMVILDISNFVGKDFDYDIYNNDHFCTLVEKINVNY